MNFLAIDTTTDMFSVALRREGAEDIKVEISGRKHSEKLLDEISGIIEKGGLALADITALGAGAGPGSFTGIRVGLSFAITFAQVLKIPLYTFSALEIAFSAERPSAIRAYRDKFYIFRPGNSSARFGIVDKSDLDSLNAVVIRADASSYLDHMQDIYDPADAGNWKKAAPIYIMETVYKPKKDWIERIK